MRQVGARLEGAAELLAELRSFGIDVDRELSAAVMGTAQNIRTKAIKSIQRPPKTGATYQKTKPKRRHVASAPGQAPATDTGRLAGDIKADISGKRAEVYTDLEYAAPLEFGTRNMAARPFMLPAMESEREAWNRRIRRVIDEAVKGIAR